MSLLSDNISTDTFLYRSPTYEFEAAADIAWWCRNNISKINGQWILREHGKTYQFLYFLRQENRVFFRRTVVHLHGKKILYYFN